MLKNKGIIFTLIFLMLAFLTYDLYARGRGGGGRSVSRSGAASGGSFSSARSSQSANRGSYSQGSKSSQVDRSSAQQKTSSNRQNYKKDGQSASSSQGKNYQQDRQDWKDSSREDRQDYGKDMQSNRQDYGDNVRDDRKEYYDDHSYRYYGSGYHHYESWGSGGAFVAGLVIGATLSAAAFSSAYPSGGCVTTYIANVSYYQCGTTWYQRAYRGGNVTYIVVNQPY